MKQDEDLDVEMEDHLNIQQVCVCVCVCVHVCVLIFFIFFFSVVWITLLCFVSGLGLGRVWLIYYIVELSGVQAWQDLMAPPEATYEELVSVVGETLDFHTRGIPGPVTGDRPMVNSTSVSFLSTWAPTGLSHQVCVCVCVCVCVTSDWSAYSLQWQVVMTEICTFTYSFVFSF